MKTEKNINEPLSLSIDELLTVIENLSPMEFFDFISKIEVIFQKKFSSIRKEISKKLIKEASMCGLKIEITYLDKDEYFNRRNRKPLINDE